jgi:hypothetical protein
MAATPLANLDTFRGTTKPSVVVPKGKNARHPKAATIFQDF